MTAVHFDYDSTLKWHNDLPAKRMGGHVVCTDELGRVLIVKPRYRSHWQLPGGVIEAAESPMDGALREATEETGLVFEASQVEFGGVFYMPEHGEWQDFMHFYFITTVASDVHLTPIDEEIEEAKFVETNELKDHLMELQLRCLSRLEEEPSTKYFG